MEEMTGAGCDPVSLAISMPFHFVPKVLRRDGHRSLPIAVDPDGPEGIWNVCEKLPSYLCWKMRTTKSPLWQFESMLMSSAHVT